MLTQCPHCLTLFRVGPEHLKVAAGQVRCCRCQKVFNALQSLQESPTPFVNSDSFLVEREPLLQEPEPRVETDTEPTPEPPEQTAEAEAWNAEQAQPQQADFEPLLPEFETTELPEELIEDILEQDDGLEPEPEYFTDGSESQMSELLDQDSSSLLLPDTEEPIKAYLSDPDNIVTFSSTAEAEPEEETGDEIQEPEAVDSEGIWEPEAVDSEGAREPEAVDSEEAWESEAVDSEDSILTDEAIDEELGRPDYDSVPAFRQLHETSPETETDDDRTLNFEAEKTQLPGIKISPLWLIGSLLLLLPLTAQLAWQFRDDLVQHTAGRQTLSLICRVAGCEVPVRRALDKIIIQGRNLSSHPDKPGVLSLQLSIVNTAAFEQPFPHLTLSLYNDKGSLIARRTFAAATYLPAEYDPLELMPKAEPILIEMDLVDPGKEVTGFSFDFY